MDDADGDCCDDDDDDPTDLSIQTIKTLL